MTDTANAPERIWAFRAGPMGGLFIGKKEVGPNVAEYVLSTHYDELVAAAHEEAFARGANWAQEKARVEGRLVIVDSPELAKLRADLAEAQEKIARKDKFGLVEPFALEESVSDLRDCLSAIAGDTP